jgi:hypothetical protein
VAAREDGAMAKEEEEEQEDVNFFYELHDSLSLSLSFSRFFIHKYAE